MIEIPEWVSPDALSAPSALDGTGPWISTQFGRVWFPLDRSLVSLVRKLPPSLHLRRPRIANPP